MWMRRLAVFNQAVVVLGSVTQLLAGTRSESLTKRKVAESLLSWSLPLNLGVLETLFFAQHVLRGGRTVEDMDQHTGIGCARSWRSHTWRSACSACSLSASAARSGSPPSSARRFSSVESLP